MLVSRNSLLSIREQSGSDPLSTTHSTAHAQYYLVYNFAQAILHDEELKSKPALHKVMTTCFELFACYTMDTEAAEFLASGYLSPKQAELTRNRVHALLSELRPQAVSLVDAWGVPDYLLNSALGRYDGTFLPDADPHHHSKLTFPLLSLGDVYPALVRFAQNEPLNRTRFNVNVDDEEIEVGPEYGRTEDRGSKL